VGLVERGIKVSRIGLGCAPIGNLFAPVTEEDAQATIDTAWDHGVRLFDTAPLYGHGLSELRLGRALRKRPRNEYVLATKVGRVLQPVAEPSSTSMFIDAPAMNPTFDFSRDGVLRSIEASLQRIGTDRLDIVHVHDPDDHEAEARSGSFPTLIELRDQGVIGAVGCGMNQCDMLERFVDTVDLDCILVAGRFSLLDRTAQDRLLPLCSQRNISVIVGGVFNSGILIDPHINPTYDYVPATDELVARAAWMQVVCRSHGVSLPAAALQFVVRHPAVTSVVVGARTADEMLFDLAAAACEIPAALWDDLRSAGLAGD
jgi:D-threo-aldose 1-dehydrogenase